MMTDSPSKSAWLIAVLALSLISGCATQRPPVQENTLGHSLAVQRQAQQAAKATPQTPELKRKIALGRVSNETLHGRSLLVDDQNDRVGKQLSDMLASRLVESGSYIVLEYPDLKRVEDVNQSANKVFQFRGVDTLVLGSLTKFGRKTVGESGFLSSTKRQVAFAEINLRLIDTQTGRVYQSLSGSGQASLESGQVAGFGSNAGYDGTLNDKAIANAVADAVDKMSQQVMNRPWFSTVLKIRNHGKEAIISGGQHQGLKPGMLLKVQTQGETLHLEQTGFDVQLPGVEVATLRVRSSFGTSETQEASITDLVSGSLANHKLSSLKVVEGQ
jgi:curli biogenesis system outer membrane secretion channel CsgG